MEITRVDLTQAAAKLIDEKLERVKKYIRDHYLVDGRMSPEHQLAYRVLQSRQRLLLRYVLTKTRPPNDPARWRAEAELTLSTQDVGDLFRWMFSNHSIGRLDCPGCDSDQAIDQMLSVPVRIPMSRVCTICGQGVQHCLVVDSVSEAVEAVTSFWQGLRVPVAQEVGLGGVQGDVGGVLFACESCYGYRLEAKP